MMNVIDYTIPHQTLARRVWVRKQDIAVSAAVIPSPQSCDPLRPLRQWLDRIDVEDRKFAHWLCKVIPSQCPFERTVKLFGRTLFNIPPLCKLNPLYEEVVALRFRSLCYLADQCGEDITPYC